MSEAGARLRRAFEAGVAAVEAGRLLGAALDLPGREDGPIRMLAIGKAAGPMSDAFLQQAGARRVVGLAVVPEAGPFPAADDRLTVLRAAHPIPDASSAEAGNAAHAFCSAASEPLWVLLSGGASSLLSAPIAPLTVDALAAATRALQMGGADIGELNTVRKHLTLASGGRLAAAAAGPVRVLAISDVTGDDLAVIGSGPFTPDPTTYAEALAVLDLRAPDGSEAIRAFLEQGCRGAHPESPKPGDPAFARVEAEILAANRNALAAIQAHAHREGAHAVVLADELVGEARTAGVRLAARARAARPARRTWLVAGGETTVTVRGTGRGGRCQELALAAALALEGSLGITLLAAGTDGIDGPTCAAGAIVDGDTIRRAREQGLDAAAALADNDATGLLSRSDALLVTGATGTNVRDVVILEIEPS